MNRQLRLLQRRIQDYDRDLFLKESHTGRVQVFSKYHGKNQYVMSLTKDWSAHGEPVNWGLLPILDKLKRIDNHNNELLFQEVEEQAKKADESRDRARRNQHEDFAHEFHRSFKKTFNDVNTANLEKIDRRRVDDRRIKNGNR